MSMITAKEAKELANKKYSTEYKLQPLFDKIKEYAEEGQYSIIVASQVYDGYVDEYSMCIINLNKKDIQYLNDIGYKISNVDIFDVTDQYSDDEDKEYVENYKIDKKGDVHGLIKVIWE